VNAHQGKDIYWVLGADLAVVLTLLIVAFAIPTHARAFSLFAWFTSSVEAGSSAVVPDANLTILTSATNADPNPNKAPRLLALSTGSALISEAGPDGTPPDADATPTNTGISVYTVRPDDTISEIAKMHDVTVNTILWANNLTSAKDIHPGDTLIILPVSGIKHMIKKGETLASLAKSYGGDPADIASFNGLDASSSLVAGVTIIIPGGEISAPAASVTPSTVVSSISKIATSLTRSLTRNGGAALPGFFGNPVPGGVITQGIHPTNAVDIGAHTGTPIYAAADGTVIVSRTGGWNGGYGIYVVISHDNGTQTLYAHMSRNVAALGSTVARGELIGYVGASGNATGAHLHFEVRNAQNPFAHCARGHSCNPE
jgi:LysM repeat protein